MDWVRIHPFIQNWPGGGPPPTFEISADENGTAIVELAWDPLALSAPANYVEPLRYYSTDVPFNETITCDDGSTRAVSIPAQTIRLSGNRATWTIPAALWEGYVQESLKTLGSRSRTTFARNLYYRVRATAPGAGQPRIWPEDALLTGANSNIAPHIGILPISATPSSQVVPDQPAIQAMGGIALVPNLWSELLMQQWRHLPQRSPSRRTLETIFAHEAYQDADLQTRAGLLKLWLFAGRDARPRLPQLLDRNAVVGSNLVQPIITKTDLRGGKTLVQNLLDLVLITPHPDLAGVSTHEQLLNHVITEILDPNGQMNQGNAGMCSPTSIQTLLITVNPAEYARLQVGLLSSQGRAVLANGDTAALPPAVLQIHRYASIPNTAAFHVRTYSELAFQAAILKYAQQSRFPAAASTPEDIERIFQHVVEAGLMPGETKRALDALFGVNFTPHYISSLPQDPNLPGCASPNPPTDPAWLTNQRAIRDDFLRDLPGRQQQMMLALYWDRSYCYGHAVMAVRRDNGRIFYKNPQYAGSNPPSWARAAGHNSNPPRRYEDPSQSLESISEADLATWIKGYWVPDHAII